MSQLPVTLDEDEIDAMLRAGDTDGNGMFDLAEMGWEIAKKEQARTELDQAQSHLS